jgi:hypothetical protein
LIPPSHIIRGSDNVALSKPLVKSWELVKNAPSRTTYCSEKNCFAHASKYAPEDHKPYCDVHLSDHMKEPKKEDQAKKVGVK